MTPLLEAAVALGRHLDEQAFPYCLIGGLAVQRWGEPRFTQDIDITLLTGFGREEKFVDALLETFQPRISTAKQFALAYRVLLLVDEHGIPIDVALGAMPFEERTIERASRWTVAENSHLRTCSAEDLVIHKAFASRDRDWVDIDGIVRRQPSLDWEMIFQELQPLAELKEAPEILTRLNKVASR